MIRLIVLLVAVLLVSALGLVTSRYEARWTTIELERARQAERALDVAWRQLQLELTQYSQHARIDALARHDLKMIPAGTDQLVHWRAAPQAEQP